MMVSEHETPLTKQRRDKEHSKTMTSQTKNYLCVIGLMWIATFSEKSLCITPEPCLQDCEKIITPAVDHATHHLQKIQEKFDHDMARLNAKYAGKKRSHLYRIQEQHLRNITSKQNAIQFKKLEEINKTFKACAKTCPLPRDEVTGMHS